VVLYRGNSHGVDHLVDPDNLGSMETITS